MILISSTQILKNKTAPSGTWAFTNMDDVKLEQANGLQKNIKIAKENLQAWQTSTGFTNSGGAAIAYRNENGDYKTGILPVMPVTFSVIKALNITHWQDVVTQLEKEFSEL